MKQPKTTRLALLNHDLAGYTRLAMKLEPTALFGLLDGYYRRAEASVEKHGGRVVKFMGDACFAVFPEDRCADAVACAEELVAEEEPFPGLVGRVSSMASVHLGEVAEGELGESGRYDVVGAEVNHLFRMGRGAGLRISEPVYRKLPNERRGAFTKHKAPAFYVAEPPKG